MCDNMVPSVRLVDTEYTELRQVSSDMKHVLSEMQKVATGPAECTDKQVQDFRWRCQVLQDKRDSIIAQLQKPDE